MAAGDSPQTSGPHTSGPATSGPQKVFIHIGVPKSGTSFIQATLRENKMALMRHGVLHPSRHKADMFHAALDICGNHERWGLSREKVEGRWAAMCERAGKFPGDIVISSEFFCGARPAQIRSALALLPDAEVHVVVTARDMARQIPAEWQEGIKHGRNVSFKQFQRRIMDPRRSHQHARRFWHYQDLPAVLARWAAVVSDERVHLVTCPPPGADPSLLWERFCSVVGIDPAWTVLPATGSNTSLGVVEIDVLRRVNRASRRPGGQRLDGRVVKHHLVRPVLRGTTSARAVTPEHLLPGLQDLAKRWRAAIEERDYQVVGDLAELNPVPSPQPEVDPDKVPPRQALRLSSVAIAQLLADVQVLREENHRLVVEARSRRSLPRRVAGRARRTLSAAKRRLLRR